MSPPHAPPTMSKTPQTLQNMPLTLNSLFYMATIFDNSRWQPFLTSNMAADAPCHLNVNLKFSNFSEFSNVWPPSTLYVYCPLQVPKKWTKNPSINDTSGLWATNKISGSVKVTHRLLREGGIQSHHAWMSHHDWPKLSGVWFCCKSLCWLYEL